MSSKSSGRKLRKESGVHGSVWGNFHGGYFSDPSVAKPLLLNLCEAVSASHPEVVVDLGGGTGYLLGALREQYPDLSAQLVNIDLSGKQLGESAHDCIHTVQCAIETFTRSRIDPHAEKFLFLMRSALHYMGKHGLKPFLHHLRAQMAKGEYFIHQTACFEKERDAECLNTLYAHMGTGKWYPQTDALRFLLEQSGWSVVSVEPAPMLPLTSDDLGKRYGLNEKSVSDICGDITRGFGETDKVFQKIPDGFCAYLHYRIFTCVAV
ncbi:MAG: methyltransferase domain-containing protein [Nitrospirota bacterium]